MSPVPRHSLHIPDRSPHQGTLSRLLQEAESGSHLAIQPSGLLSADTEDRQTTQSGRTDTWTEDGKERHKKDSKEVAREMKTKGETSKERKRVR